MKLKTDDLLFVRPSTNNMHEFVAEENSCFFDICLPNYTTNKNYTRKMAFYKEINENPHLIKGGMTTIEYNVTPPVMPANMDITDVDYRGSYESGYQSLTNFDLE